ncbi:hypothetical protein FQN55_007641 [Onygenales sp. PD_40]|nr:hypothetical protein FQN55_007641 [Onygenales sp. PD_40]
MENFKAVEYLQSLLGKTLHIHTTDTRLFAGTFKCTDNDRNIILSGTQEYRYPTSIPLPTNNDDNPANSAEEADSTAKNVVRANMTSRYIGLVVIPGQYITKIELDDYRPQQAGRRVSSAG